MLRRGPASGSRLFEKLSHYAFRRYHGYGLTTYCSEAVGWWWYIHLVRDTAFVLRRTRTRAVKKIPTMMKPWYKLIVKGGERPTELLLSREIFRSLRKLLNSVGEREREIHSANYRDSREGTFKPRRTRACPIISINPLQPEISYKT